MVIGLLAAPDLSYKIAESLQRDLPRILERRDDGQAWQVCLDEEPSLTNPPDACFDGGCRHDPHDRFRDLVTPPRTIALATSGSRGRLTSDESFPANGSVRRAAS